MDPLNLKYFLIVLFLNSASFQLFSQGTESDIQQIRGWYAEVEGLLNDCEEIDLADYTAFEVDGPTEIKAFYHPESNKIIKIVMTIFQDWHEESNQHYLKDHQLFFTFTDGYFADEMYTAEELDMDEDQYFMNGGEAKTLAYYQYRTYYKKKEVIRFLSKEKVIAVSDDRPDLSKIPNVTESIKDAPDAPDIAGLVEAFLSQIDDH